MGKYFLPVYMLVLLTFKRSTVMTFGEFLKKARTNAKMSQETLAKQMGINRVSISNYEKNKNTPTVSNLKKIAKILNVDVSEFINDENIKPVKLIPLIGVASCGVPNIAFPDAVEYIPVSEEYAREGVYAVQADGDSMLPRIAHGDIVLCDKEMDVVNGNIVHYTTIDGESGLKKYQEKDGIVTLYPLNTDGYAPVVIPKEDLRLSRAFKVMSDL